jgi:predicted transcriptional regulator
MVAAQNMVQTLLGIDNSTKGKQVETIIRKAATTVSKTVHDWVFEQRDWDKTVQVKCLLQLIPVASCSKLKRHATQGYVCFGDL